MDLQHLFAAKTTENGDLAFVTTGNVYLDILFKSEYYRTHLNEMPSVPDDFTGKIFSMFMRDPRLGLGQKNVGRQLLGELRLDPEVIALCGRYDDLWKIAMTCGDSDYLTKTLDFLFKKITENDALCKKWMPRYSSANLSEARYIAQHWGLNKQEYGKFVKTTTIESQLSQHQEDDIVFEHIPSLAAIKYFKALQANPKTHNRYMQYLEDVKAGKKELHVSTTNVYDIYKNRDKIDAQLFFDKLSKCKGNWIPVIDTSGSMMNNNDSFGKALAIGHYLAKCSTYAPNYAISFSSHPVLIKLGVARPATRCGGWGSMDRGFKPNPGASKYLNEIHSLNTGDCSNTDFGAVMKILKGLDKHNAPEFIVVLSDMEFDQGSNQSKEETMALFKAQGFNTKIVWWNLNERRQTCPEMDSDGNIFMSGYNPMLLKYLETGFNGTEFLNKLLQEYFKAITK